MQGTIDPHHLRIRGVVTFAKFPYVTFCYVRLQHITYHNTTPQIPITIPHLKKYHKLIGKSMDNISRKFPENVVDKAKFPHNYLGSIRYFVINHSNLVIDAALTHLGKILYEMKRGRGGIGMGIANIIQSDENFVVPRITGSSPCY